MQLSATATGTAAAVAATRPRVTGNVSGGRARAKLRNEVVVLCSLRRSQLKILVFGLEVRQLALRKEVEDGAAVLVVRVDDVARRVLHGVARVARLRRHVVAHLRDRGTVLAAIMLS